MSKDTETRKTEVETSIIGGEVIKIKRGERWVIAERIITVKEKESKKEIQFKILAPLTEDYIKAIFAAGARLRLNVMSDRIEGRTGKPFSDTEESLVVNRLRDYGLKSKDRIRDCIREMAHHARYHPVKEYLEGLPEWDGTSRFDQLMGKLSMPTPKARVFWRKWLLGCIAKTYKQSRTYMLVMMGRQNFGKSFLVRWLCPLPNLFYEGPIQPDNKDYLIRMVENWISEASELDATTRKADRAALKSTITTIEVKARRAYGHYDIVKPVSVNWIGTLNPEDGFLNDKTGNSRFAIVQVDDIDFSYTDIDKDQLWAELFAAYKGGESWDLTTQEREVQEEINLQNTTESPIEAALKKYYDYGPEAGDHLTSLDIMQQLEEKGIRGNQHFSKIEIGRILKGWGVASKRKTVEGKKITVYVGMEVSALSIGEL